MRYLSLPRGMSEAEIDLARSKAEKRCSVAEAAQVIGDRWAILVMREVFYGRSRFEEFERVLGVASNILSGRLKSLVGAGLLERRSSVEAKRPGYHLTEKGRAFFPVYVALKCWADDWSSSQEGVVTELFDSKSGQRIRSAPLLREDGSEVACEDVVVWGRSLETNSR